MVIISKHDNAVLMELKDGEIILGRAHDNDVCIDDLKVSARHARIYTYMAVSYIEDLGSTNGTFIKGKRIQKHVLHAGDVVSLGDYEMVFNVHPMAAQQKQMAQASSVVA